MALLLLVLLVGCAHRAPPPVFVTEMVVAENPPSTTIDPEPGDCLRNEALRAGDTAECSGALIPKATLADYLQAETHRDYWQENNQRCERYRQEDRSYAERVCAASAQQAAADRRELQVYRVLVPVGTGLLVGGAFAGGMWLGATVAP